MTLLTKHYPGNKEIELFQQRLDETSGLLSEQKIKSSELEKTLEQCRKDYDERLAIALLEGKETKNTLKSHLEGYKELLDNAIG